MWYVKPSEGGVHRYQTVRPYLLGAMTRAIAFGLAGCALQIPLVNPVEMQEPRMKSLEEDLDVVEVTLDNVVVSHDGRAVIICKNRWASLMVLEKWTSR